MYELKEPINLLLAKHEPSCWEKVLFNIAPTQMTPKYGALLVSDNYYFNGNNSNVTYYPVVVYSGASKFSGTFPHMHSAVVAVRTTYLKKCLSLICRTLF